MLYLSYVFQWFLMTVCWIFKALSVKSALAYFKCLFFIALNSAFCKKNILVMLSASNTVFSKLSSPLYFILYWPVFRSRRQKNSLCSVFFLVQGYRTWHQKTFLQVVRCFDISSWELFFLYEQSLFRSSYQQLRIDLQINLYFVHSWSLFHAVHIRRKCQKCCNSLFSVAISCHWRELFFFYLTIAWRNLVVKEKISHIYR